MEPTRVTTAARPSPVRVCGYANRSFAEVAGDLDGPAGRATFARAFTEATGSTVELSSRRQATVSEGVACYAVDWRVEDRRSTASVTVMAVQGGREPVTEVLVHVELVDAERGTHPDTVARLLAQFIEALCADLDCTQRAAAR